MFTRRTFLQTRAAALASRSFAAENHARSRDYVRRIFGA